MRNLAPGTEIIVIVTGLPPATRYLIAQSESALTVLNVTGATLPFAARDELRDVVSHHPEYIAATQQGRAFVLGKHVRLEPDGVFVADRKVADLTDVIENIGRSDVVEINTSARERSRLGCGFVGYAGWWLGGMAGGMTGGFIGWEVSNTDGGALGGMALGALVGGTAGGVWSVQQVPAQAGRSDLPHTMKSTLALTLAVSLVWALPAAAQAQVEGPGSSRSSRGDPRGRPARRGWRACIIPH